MADIGTLQRLPRIVGDQRAAELTYTARTFNGTEALRMGLVLECFDSEAEMMTHVKKVAADIASKSPITTRYLTFTQIHVLQWFYVTCTYCAHVLTLIILKFSTEG